MSCVVVAEHGLLGAAGPDAHDHGGMIARVRENVTPWKNCLATVKWILNLQWRTKVCADIILSSADRKETTKLFHINLLIKLVKG